MVSWGLPGLIATTSCRRGAAGLAARPAACRCRCAFKALRFAAVSPTTAGGRAGGRAAGPARQTRIATTRELPRKSAAAAFGSTTEVPFTSKITSPTRNRPEVQPTPRGSRATTRTPRLSTSASSSTPSGDVRVGFLSSSATQTAPSPRVPPPPPPGRLADGEDDGTRSYKERRLPPLLPPLLPRPLPPLPPPPPPGPPPLPLLLPPADCVRAICLRFSRAARLASRDKRRFRRRVIQMAREASSRRVTPPAIAPGGVRGGMGEGRGGE